AVPANNRCGYSAAAAAADAAPNWAPLAYTYAGFWEVSAAWVEEHLGSLQVVDVREPEEYTGPLGHIAGARLLPLGQLSEGVAALDRERPVVTVCRAGGRSAQATLMLQKAGFAKVANLSGGMLRWHAQGLAVAGTDQN